MRYNAMQNSDTKAGGGLTDTTLDRVWLLYYNEYLDKNGAITSAQKRKVEQEIFRLYPE